jgi:hypothetical protein
LAFHYFCDSAPEEKVDMKPVISSIDSDNQHLMTDEHVQSPGISNPKPSPGIGNGSKKKE